MQRASVRFQQRLTERLAERGMRVDEPCRIGKRDTVADQLFGFRYQITGDWADDVHAQHHLHIRIVRKRTADS